MRIARETCFDSFFCFLLHGTSNVDPTLNTSTATPTPCLPMAEPLLLRALVNLIALILPGFILIPFSTAHSPRVPRSFCNFSMSFLLVISLYITQSSAKSQTFESMFLQISFTYTRNSSGPKTVPCGTPEITLTSLDSCLPTLTLCVQPTRNSLTRTTTLEFTPEATSFVSNRS